MLSGLIILRPAPDVRPQFRLWPGHVLQALSKQGPLPLCSALTSPNLYTALQFLFPRTAIAMLFSGLKYGEMIADCTQRRPRSLFRLISFISPHLLAPRKGELWISCWYTSSHSCPNFNSSFTLKSYPSFRVLLRFSGNSLKIHLFPHYFSSAFH